jgi:lipopolysaccharide export system protein LptC
MAGSNRYSTAVTWLKVLLPMIALALLSTLFLFARKPDPEAALPYADVDVAQLVREQRLSRPRFAGTLEDGREVTLVADTAAAAVDDPSTITMTDIESRVVLSGDTALLLSAEHGDLDLGGQVVALDGAVNAATTNGYEMTTDRLTVAMDAMRLTAPGGVVLTGPGLTIEAGAMELSGHEGAAFLSLTGGVRLLYDAGG